MTSLTRFHPWPPKITLTQATVRNCDAFALVDVAELHGRNADGEPVVETMPIDVPPCLKRIVEAFDLDDPHFPCLGSGAEG